MSIKIIRRLKHSQGGESGQSLVEFALSLTVLILIVSGLLDLGRLYYIYVALEDGVGEAALYLSINPACYEPPGAEHPEVPSACADPNNARWRAIHSGGGMLDWADVEYVPVVIANPTVTDTVEVTLRYEYEPITPFITRLTGGDPITLRVHAAEPVVSVRPIH